MALEGTVKTPLGPMKKQTALVVGGGAVLLLGIAYWRHKKSAAAAAASTATSPATIPAGSATDPYPADGTIGNPADPYSTDPATGMTYGDEQAGFGTGFGGGFTGGGTSGGGGGNGPGTFSTNAQWGQFVEQQMGSTGSDAIASAIGHYLGGLPVTSDQQTIILEAIAIGGQPPVGGTNGFPPSIDLQEGGGGGGNAANPVTGLRVTQSGFTGADISWNPSAGATGYQVTSDKGNVTMTGATSARIGSIGPSHTQATVHVLATPAAAGAQAARLIVSVK